jgi:hypothetical protein
MLKALKETPNQFSDLSRIECSYIDDSVDLSRKLISRLYDPKEKSKRCHIDLNKLRVKLPTVKNSTLVSLPPSEDTFKQYVLRSSVQDQTFHLSNHVLEVTQLLTLEYVHLTQSNFRHVGALRYIILTLSQRIFALLLKTASLTEKQQIHILYSVH